ncbi:hypothetical protein H6F77_01375 [Microcoleus sp. FACHB-831]|uniref:hypothetical protein n=1 Tax=Microcoleus sp. FACHB-831 TaxID=2692827 RepID=UPI001689E8AA|nr:hypothetical protein [Microcoleus sp. FACHB-831]MBD1919772.1 hypothetical protein [Microcoleus sp. FACHB-831]
MTNPDIRSLITSKSRPKVTPRDASLSLNRSKEVEEASALTEISDADDSAQTNVEPQELQRLQAELENLPQVGKRLAVHLEQGIRADLLRVCESQEITPETFIEAAIALLQSKPELKEEVVADAKVRLRERKRAGLVKRTMALVQKYSG